MRLSQKKRTLLRTSAALIASMLFCSAATAQQMPTYQQEQNYTGRIMDPNTRFVAMPTGLAKMTALHFTMPKDTVTYNLTGMTIFPYYQASPQLQSFLNSRVGGIPITSFGSSSPSGPTIQLPPTDTVHLNIPLFERRIENTAPSTRMAWRKDLHDEVSWRIAHQGGQSFAVPGDPSAVVLASSGTMFNAAAARTMALRCGTMWVITGSRPVAVLTKYGAVSVSPYSIAAVEQTWFNKVRTGVLYGSPLEFQFAYKGNSNKVNLDRGKELTVTESAVASAGTSDYVEHSKSPDLIAANLPITPVPVPNNLNLVTRKIDPDASSFIYELKSVTPPIADLRMANAYQHMFDEYGITKSMRRDALRRQILLKDTAIASKQPAAYKASLDDRYFVPSYKPIRSTVPVMFPRVDEPLKALWVQHGVVKYLASSKIDVDHSGRLEMNSGEAIFSASEPMCVRANDCFLQIKDGAIVQVIARKDTVVVRNLKEVANTSVQLKVRSRTIDCAAGEEIIVAATMPTVYAEMKSDGVTRRNVHIIETCGGNVIINKSEIELTSLLQYNPSMRQLYDSKDQYDQKLLAQIVKMDAVLTMLTRNRGNYQRMAGMPASHQ
jgi:hypothetical protein